MMATWRRALRFILLGWLLATAGGALAQTPAAPAAPTTTSAVEIERLIATLQDEQARARLLGELRVLLEAQRRQAPGAEPEESSPETLTARLLALLADQIAAVSDAGQIGRAHV